MLALVVLAVAGCKSLPPKVDVPTSVAIDAAELTYLEKISKEVLAGAADREASAHILIERNDEALAWRLALIDSAEHSLDLQTFIFQGDASGYLLSDRRRLEEMGKPERCCLIVFSRQPIAE